MNFAADDFEAIRRREEEIKAERALILTGTAVPVEEPKNTESWASYMMGYDYDPA
mgnify:FL=1